MLHVSITLIKILSIIILLISLNLQVQNIIVFEQRFITPNEPLQDNCGAPDFDITPLNTVWSITATGSSGGVRWNKL